jgi:hypothetical protein
MTGQEIRAATDGLLRIAFEQAVGSRPRRYQPTPDVLDGLCLLAGEAVVQHEQTPGEWRVVEGRRWLVNRRLDGRSVPLVQRDHVALLVRSWGEARTVAALLNWCNVPPPPRHGARTPAFIARRTP